MAPESLAMISVAASRKQLHVQILVLRTQSGSQNPGVEVLVLKPGVQVLVLVETQVLRSWS